MRTQKTIRRRGLRRGTPEEELTPGEAVVIQKQGGKVFELRRTDSGGKSIVTQLDELFEDTPNPGKQTRTDLARIIAEERE